MHFIHIIFLVYTIFAQLKGKVRCVTDILRKVRKMIIPVQIDLSSHAQSKPISASLMCVLFYSDSKKFVCANVRHKCLQFLKSSDLNYESQST